MASQKRGRACLACAAIKIKCQLGSDLESRPPCERCQRLGKECVLTRPQRQKDRVKELEDHVASLTRLLQAHGIDSSPRTEDGQQDPPARVDHAPVTAKKRRCVPETPITATVAATMDAKIASDQLQPDLTRLDRVVSSEVQGQLVGRYLTEIVPKFPVVPINGDCSVNALKQDRPILLLAVIWAGSVGVLNYEAQEEVADVLLRCLAAHLHSPETKTLELLQATLISCLWFRVPKHHRTLNSTQLTRFASGLATDIGIGGALSFHDLESQAEGMCTSVQRTSCLSVDVYRAWLVCHVLSAALAIFMRTKLPMDRHHHDLCITYLDTSPFACPSDKWLVQYFRAERLVEHIANEAGSHDPSSFHDHEDPSASSWVQKCRTHLLEWRVQVRQSSRTPLLLFMENLATAYMHEPLLYTATNKSTFSAPYVADRLSLSDFPTPIPSQQHITAVYELVSAIHAMIDIYSSFDEHSLLACSGTLLGARAAYANYILAKIYIALTAPGSTLGAVIDPSMLRIDEHCTMLVEAGAKVKLVDARSPPALFGSAATRMQEWLTGYNAYLLGDIKQPGQATSSELSFSGSADALSEQLLSAPTFTDWYSFLQEPDNTAFNLDFLFHEPLAGVGSLGTT